MTRSSFWDRQTEGRSPSLFGTVTNEEAVVTLRDRLERAHLDRVLELTGQERVLDLGGGAGRIALWLAPRVAEVTLVDRSAALLDRAKRGAVEAGVALRLVQADAAAFEPQAGAYDLIVVFGVLTYLPDEALDRVVDRLADALRPGGTLVLKEPVTTDGVLREDLRPDEGYHARFRPREAYAERFARRLPLRYQRPTVAHPIPAFLGGTQEAAAHAGEGRAAAGVLRAVTPLWVRADPAVATVERWVRSTPGLNRLLAPVDVLQDLYVFASPRTGPATLLPPERPALSVVVLAYNEEEAIEAVVLELLSSLERLEAPTEVILVDDGSTDATLSLMQRLAAEEPTLRVLPLSPNRGIGGALRAGFDAARGAHVTWVPGDGQIAPSVLRTLFDRRGEAPMLTTVYAGRDDAWYRHAMSRGLNALIRLRTGQVAKSGGNYLFERGLWEAHAPRGDDTMMLSTAFRQRLRDAQVPLVEVPIHARRRVAGRSKVLNASTILRTLAATLVPSGSDR